MAEVVQVEENKSNLDHTPSEEPERAAEAAEKDEEERDVDEDSLEQPTSKGQKRGVGARGRPQRLPKSGGSKTRSGSARLLHVSGQSPVKQVAGAISWISRAGECPKLLATLAPAINQAAKAVAIARKFLEEDKIDIACYPMFTPGRRRQDESFTFLLRKSTVRPLVLDDGTQELKVSKQSNPGTVAGAIAARVREGQRVVLSSIGPLSVSKAISSIAIARQYLAKDGVDISFRPSFLNIEFNDGRRSSCLQFQLLAQQI
jgi:stage V sporulation protein S